MALAESLDAEGWPHVTMTEIWGSHAPNGSACRLLLSTLHREAGHEQRQNLTAYGHAEEHPHAGGEASHISVSLLHAGIHVAAENSEINVDATAVPMAPASCCMVFITAEPSAFMEDGNWFNACV